MIVTAYFETNGSARQVGVFPSEEAYNALIPELEAQAESQGMILTESVDEELDFFGALPEDANPETWGIYCYAMKLTGNDIVCAELFDRAQGHTGEPDFYDIMVRPHDMEGDEDILEYENLTNDQATILKTELEQALGMTSEDVDQ